MSAENKIKSRAYLLGLFAVFFGPLFFATWLFFVPKHWLNSGMQNHGTLIQPAVPLDDFKITNVKGEQWDKTQFMGKWTLLYIADGACNLYCEASLFKMRQVRLSLGRDRQRVARKFMGVARYRDEPHLNEILKSHQHMQISWFEDNALYTLQSAYWLEKNHIYLIDPLGNLMMRYTEDATSAGIKKDLKRLLKVSKIG